MAYKSNQTKYVHVLRMKKGKIDSGVNRVNRDMFLYYFNWQEQNFLYVFIMISFSLCFFYCSDQYKMGTKNMKPPFSLTFNLQYIIFPCFYLFIFQKEQNLTRSSSLEIKNSFSLLRWLAFV